MVGMDPAAVSRGGGQFTRHGEALVERATSVAELESLQAAFAGTEMWPMVQARLREITSRIEAAQQRATHAGTTLTAFADGTTAIDQRHRDAMRAQ